MTDDTARKTDAPMPMLEKRRIEAAILNHVYDVLADSHGEQEAEAVISKAVIRSAIEQGEQFRKQHEGGEPDLADFAALGSLWELGGALEREVLVSTADRYEFNMVRCGYADMYKQMGLARIGRLLSCNRDATFCRGFNPAIELTRTQTIMEGADHCDFRYRMKKRP